MRQQRLPHHRQPHAAAVAVEQRRAELPFQHPDLLAQRGLRDEQPLRGAGEVQLLGHGDEVPQVPPVHIHNHQLSQRVLDGPPGSAGRVDAPGPRRRASEERTRMSRVWLITGASSGFGRAIAEAAVAAGDMVVGTARRVAALDDLAAAHPGQAEALPLDVTDTAAIEAAVQDVIARHGRIDVLVNNAGRTHVGAVEETTDAELRGLLDVHVLGPAALTRAVLPHMRARRSGRDRPDEQHGRADVVRRVRRLQRHQVRAGGHVGGTGRRGRPARHQGADRRAGRVPHRLVRQQQRQPSPSPPTPPPPGRPGA